MKRPLLLIVAILLSFTILPSIDSKASAQQAGQESAPKLLPTHADVPYAPHAKTVIDFWQAEGDTPRPLLVYIHGGGWIGGDKKRSAADVKPYLDQGISYASVNYRLSGEASLPVPVHDAARAIQFLRSKADEWNIREDRIALTGGSGGVHIDVAAVSR